MRADMMRYIKEVSVNTVRSDRCFSLAEWIACQKYDNFTIHFYKFTIGLFNSESNKIW